MACPLVKDRVLVDSKGANSRLILYFSPSQLHLECCWATCPYSFVPTCPHSACSIVLTAHIRPQPPLARIAKIYFICTEFHYILPKFYFILTKPFQTTGHGGHVGRETRLLHQNPTTLDCIVGVSRVMGHLADNPSQVFEFPGVTKN